MGDDKKNLRFSLNALKKFIYETKKIVVFIFSQMLYLACKKFFFLRTIFNSQPGQALEKFKLDLF